MGRGKGGELGAERVQTARSSYRFLILALCAFAAQIEPARADDSQRQVVPEFNAFIKLSERTRVYLQADVAHGLTEATTDGELFAYLDITLKPILRAQLREADWERNRYLWVRIGYEAAGNLEGLRLRIRFKMACRSEGAARRICFSAI